MKDRIRVAGVIAFAAALALTIVLDQNGRPALAQTSPIAAAPADPLPNARPGECYAKVFVPEVYKTVTEKIMVKEASARFEITPAKYETVQEKVQLTPATFKLVATPAKYDMVTEKVEIAPARTEWRTGTGAKATTASETLVATALALGIPLTAKPGECYAEYVVPAQYKDEEVKVIAKEASETIEIIPAKYEWVEEKVVVQDAATAIEEIPAKYNEVTEKVLEQPAYTTWKTGSGTAVGTGEVMCLIEVPAAYTEYTKAVVATPASVAKKPVEAEHTVVKVQKLVSPATEKRTPVPAEYQTLTKKVKVSDAKVVWRLKGAAGPGEATGRDICLVDVPAKFKTVEKRVIKAPAKVERVEVPATFKTVQRKKLVTPAVETRVEIPAEYEEITKKVKVADGKLEWKSVLCNTNTTPDLVTKIQSALKTQGYDPGPVDGQLGQMTLTAVDSFQRKNGLARGGLTMQTIQKLGVTVTG